MDGFITIIILCIIIGVIVYLINTSKAFRRVVAVLLVVIGIILILTGVGSPLGVAIGRCGTKLMY